MLRPMVMGTRTRQLAMYVVLSSGIPDGLGPSGRVRRRACVQLHQGMPGDMG